MIIPPRVRSLTLTNHQLKNFAIALPVIVIGLAFLVFVMVTTGGSRTVLSQAKPQLFVQAPPFSFGDEASIIRFADSATLVPNASLILAPQAIEMWWPLPDVTVGGTQPFKTLVQGQDITTYAMYWQVDNGQLNEMYDSYTDYPHKEAWVDVSTWKWQLSGSYVLTFTAKDSTGNILASRSFSIYAHAPISVPLPPAMTPIDPESTTQKVEPIVTSTSLSGSSSAVAPSVNSGNPVTGNPVSGMDLWVNPNSEPKRWADSRRSSDVANALLMDKIAEQPDVQWYGNWNSDVARDVDERVSAITTAGKLPVIVAYNIPQRDCGGYSAGGSNSPDAYKQWIRNFAKGIGSRKSVVILEPDVLTMSDCLAGADRQTRFGLLKDAISVLNALGNTYVYLDAGHSGWKSVDEIAALLKKGGVEHAQGFALNVSNFQTNSSTIAYGTAVSNQIGGKHFVFDTGRNGNGPATNNEWCNPWGRSLGSKPTTNTGHALVDAYLWVRGPSGSDGTCNGGLSAGTFWPEYGLELARNTAW